MPKKREFLLNELIDTDLQLPMVAIQRNICGDIIRRRIRLGHSCRLRRSQPF